MSTLTLLSGAPNFQTGQVIQASPYNTNWANLLSWSTSIDNTNIGGAGIFASQIIPTSGAQATFGGAQPYTFPGALGIGTTPVNTGAILSINGGGNGIAMAAGDFALGTGAAAGNIWFGTGATPGYLAYGNVSGVYTLADHLGKGHPIAGGSNAAGAALTFIPPVYTKTGAARASTCHIVLETQFQAAGGSSTITLTNDAVFATTATWYVFDTTALTIATITAQGLNSVTFNSTLNHFYNIFAIGD